MAQSSQPQFSRRQKIKNAYGGNPPIELGYAVKAFCACEATPEQQGMVWDYLQVLTGLNDPEFALPASVEVSNHRSGMRLVGLQLNELADTPVKTTI